MKLLNIFPDSVKNFAESFGLSSWDWSAILISILSFALAIWSLCVARRTLKSQRKTEKNTTPAINRDVQLFLLNNKIKEAYESFIHLLLLKVSLEGVNVDGINYKVKPTSQFWNVVRLNVDELHEHLFYNNVEQFSNFHTLVDFIKFYNEDIKVLEEFVNNPNINASYKRAILKKSIENLFPIIQLWYNCAKICFNLSDLMITQILHDGLVDATDLYIERIYKIRNIPLGSSLEVTKEYMEEHPGNQYVSEHIETFVKLFNEFISNNGLELSLADFKENTFRRLDSIMMNTPYKSNGALISFIYKGNVGNGSANIIFNISNSSESFHGNSYVPNTQIDSNDTSISNPSTWLYQIVDL